MKNFASLWFLVIAAALPLAARAAPPSELCTVLRAFVKSVQPDQYRAFTHHTMWGGNFKGETEPAIFAKRCIHEGYEPAAQVCAYLMKHGSTEFSGYNVKNAITCLSKATRFAPGMELYTGTFSFSYGSPHRGALIDITLTEDKELGGTAFRLQANGY